MNDRIKELKDQATTRKFDGTGTDMGKLVLDEQKFAQLIVRECIGITDELVDRNADGTWTSNELYTDYNGALFEVKRRIEETFGVEE